MSQAAADRAFMAQALRLAALGRYSTHPNPAVGCVLVQSGKAVGDGYHLQAGGPHAEALALAAAGKQARGATCYVTLEPCSFAGKTPSCARALAEAGVAEVHAAMLDPDPRNAGAGMALLKDAGLAVQTGLLAAEAAALNPGHIKRHERGLPYVRLKLAMTLDGRTALASGESRWITSEPARADVQRLRARASALVTGVETIIADDPSLRVREDMIDLPHPKEAREVQREVFVLDSQGRTPAKARALALPGTCLVTGEAAQPPQGAERLTCPLGPDGRIDLPAFFKSLAERGHSEALLECGPTLAGAAIAAKMVDEVVLYAAPSFMGASARPLLHLPEIARMPDLVKATITSTEQLGPDLKITLKL